jgi:hypothetical protein
MRTLRKCPDRPFGGAVVVVMADFHQLPSVAGISLHKALVSLELPTEQLFELGVIRTVKGKTQGQLTDLGADRKGAVLFRKFKRMTLTQQMRAAEDPVHVKNIEALRLTSAAQPVSEEFINSLQPLTVEAVDRVGDALRFAPIACLGHRERDAFNYSQAQVYARRHGQILFWWKRELTGASAGWLSEEEEKLVYEHERAGVCGFFVAGAPGCITHNINTNLGLVNGCDCTFHSVTLPDDLDVRTYIEEARELFHASNAVWDGLLEVQIPTPLSVNVIPKIHDDAKKGL